MISTDLITALELPANAIVQKRVAKKLLLDNGAPTTADKRRINDGIEELIWVAALKPTTIGVKEFKDEYHEYLEIAVLHLSMRPGASSARLNELVHRAIPYPLLLLSDEPGATELTAAHKRWALNEHGKTVLDGQLISTRWDTDHQDGHWSNFRIAMSLGSQPRSSLYALYQGWIDTLRAHHVSRLTNEWKLTANPDQASSREEALNEHGRLEEKIASLRAAAAKEKQLSRRVELNNELKLIERKITAVRSRL